MKKASDLKQFAVDCANELLNHILPFWMDLMDDRGGFYGEVTSNLMLHPDAPKGVILHARILWTFSSVYLKTGKQQYLDTARHAYAFLQQAWDDTDGGFFWTLTPDGEPLETDKYTYCNAFCIFSLCVYFEAAQDKKALELARKTAAAIEAHCACQTGYGEAYTHDWLPIINEHLSEYDLHPSRTMNTTLHLIEAYAALYRRTKDAEIGEKLRALLELTAERIYNPVKQRLEVFFDSRFGSLGNVDSYGHDIEASWVLTDACDALEDSRLKEQFQTICFALAAHVRDTAFSENAIYSESYQDKADQTRVWWVLAEGVIGFLNAAQASEDILHDTAEADSYYQCALRLWGYIKQYQIDRKNGGEWYAETDVDGRPKGSHEMAGLWKCPYHNTRMCLEVIQRIKAVLSSFGGT